MNSEQILSDPRRRNLAVLATLAFFSILLAVIALTHRAAVTAPKYPPESYFPGLAGEVNQITRIHIASKKDGAFDVTFLPAKGWVLPGRGNYPASYEQVHKTVVGLAALQTVAPKTSRPDWYHYLNLDPPPNGNGMLIQLENDKGDILASVITGKNVDIGDQTGLIGLFVRKPADAQSWLVRSPFQPSTSQTDWMDKKVVNVDRARIAETDVHPAGGAAYTVSRATSKDTDFTLSAVPRGRELQDPSAADGVGGAIADFSFDDIKPSSAFDFGKDASRVVTKTFDGLIVTVDMIKQGSDCWARVFADAMPGKPEAAKEASEINAHAAGWAYKLDTYRGGLFATTLESLLKPKSGKK